MSGSWRSDKWAVRFGGPAQGGLRFSERRKEACDEDDVQLNVGKYLERGRNTIRIQFEDGTSHYWIKWLMLEAN